MNANELVSKITETQTITFSFGKNGWGLSDEFITIGNKIKELSKTYNVYLTVAQIDSLDDVYDLTFKLYPHTEDNPTNCKDNLIKCGEPLYTKAKNNFNS